MKYYVTIGDTLIEHSFKYAAVELTQQLLDEVQRLRGIVIDSNVSEVVIETDAVTWVADEPSEFYSTYLHVFSHSLVFDVVVVNEGKLVTDNIPIRDFEEALALPEDAEDETYINDDVFVLGGNVYNGVDPEEVQ